MGGSAVLSGPEAWTRATYPAEAVFSLDFEPTHLEEIRRAVARWRDSEITLRDLLDRPPPFRSLDRFIEKTKADLSGRGFVLWRGLPVEEWSIEEAEMVFWSLGAHLGTGVTQNARADLVCHVYDAGVRFGYKNQQNQANARGYQSRGHLNFHCDAADVVGLLCIRQARSGGVSRIVSSASIYNEIAREHPEYLPVLRRGFVYGRKGEEAQGEPPYTDEIPVFEENDGIFSCRFLRSFIEDGAAKSGRAIGRNEAAVLDFVQETADRDDLVVTMDFRPGDVQLLNNYTVLHSRTDYEDDPDPAKARRLLRLWLRVEDFMSVRQRSDTMRFALGRYGNMGLSPRELAAHRPGGRPQQELTS